jgi:Tfp pilus assembly protein FimT
MRLRRPAYTLLEIVLVVAIVVILASIALPSFHAMLQQQKLDSSADAFRAALAFARGRAIEEGRPFRVAIVPGKGNFRAAADSSDAWSGGDPTPDPSGKESLVMEDALPKGIALSVGSDPQRPQPDSDTVLEVGKVGPDSWKTVAVFLPTGNARTDAEVNILPAEGRGLVIVLRALTAETTVRKFNPGGR